MKKRISEERRIILKLHNGEEWAVPVMVVAENRAKHYSSEYHGDIDRSLQEDTLPLFRDDPSEIKEWMANQMDWDDLKDCAVKVKEPDPITEKAFRKAYRKGKYRVE